MKEEFTYKNGVLSINWDMYKRAMAIIGAKGGRVSSPKKREASRKSLAKARAVRMANMGKVVAS